MSSSISIRSFIVKASCKPPTRTRVSYNSFYNYMREQSALKRSIGTRVSRAWSPSAMTPERNIMAKAGEERARMRARDTSRASLPRERPPTRAPRAAAHRWPSRRSQSSMR